LSPILVHSVTTKLHLLPTTHTWHYFDVCLWRLFSSNTTITPAMYGNVHKAPNGRQITQLHNTKSKDCTVLPVILPTKSSKWHACNSNSSYYTTRLISSNKDEYKKTAEFSPKTPWLISTTDGLDLINRAANRSFKNTSNPTHKTKLYPTAGQKLHNWD
jgi:hypothetical protein